MPCGALVASGPTLPSAGNEEKGHVPNYLYWPLMARHLLKA